MGVIYLQPHIQLNYTDKKTARNCNMFSGVNSRVYDYANMIMSNTVHCCLSDSFEKLHCVESKIRFENNIVQ